MYRSPLSCFPNETISTLAFDSQHIALIIDGAIASKWRLELRTRGMAMVKWFLLEDQLTHASIVPLQLRTEWLFRYKTQADQPWKYYSIDQDLHQHEEKQLWTKDIAHIDVRKSSSKDHFVTLTYKTHIQGDTMKTSNALLFKSYKISS